MSSKLSIMDIYSSLEIDNNSPKIEEVLIELIHEILFERHIMDCKGNVDISEIKNGYLQMAKINLELCE